MTVHVIGAGLSGLTAALTLQTAGVPTCLHESSTRPGGRCGGWQPSGDAGRRDRGTHLILSGNETLQGLIHQYCSPEGWIRLPPYFRFHDLQDGSVWSLRPAPGRWPGWLFRADRRVAGAGILEHLRLLLTLELSRANHLGEAFDLTTPIGRRLLAPLAIALLNTPAATASLPLLRRTLRGSLYRGGGALSPLLCRTSLEDDLITPLVQTLRAAGGEIRLRSSVSILQQTVTGLSLSGPDGPISAGSDPVILAVDPTSAHRLLPDHLPLLPQSPILNLHFPTPEATLTDFTGVCGGLTEWIFRRPGYCAITISAADPARPDQPDLAAAIWAEVRQVYPDLPQACPEGTRILTERRATLLQTPEVDRLRPAPQPAGPDWPPTLWLAGDWVQTGLPCTLEGAARSGVQAAQAVLQHLSRHG